MKKLSFLILVTMIASCGGGSGSGGNSDATPTNSPQDQSIGVGEPNSIPSQNCPYKFDPNASKETNFQNGIKAAIAGCEEAP